jgi:hypothetical protein
MSYGIVPQSGLSALLPLKRIVSTVSAAVQSVVKPNVVKKVTTGIVPVKQIVSTVSAAVPQPVVVPAAQPILSTTPLVLLKKAVEVIKQTKEEAPVTTTTSKPLVSTPPLQPTVTPTLVRLNTSPGTSVVSTATPTPIVSVEPISITAPAQPETPTQVAGLPTIVIVILVGIGLSMLLSKKG